MRLEWSPVPGASQYRLEIVTPNGTRIEAPTAKPFHERYLESLPWEGEFHEGDLIRVERGREGLEFKPASQGEVILE